MNSRKPWLVRQMKNRPANADIHHHSTLYRFMIHYMGDQNPALDHWAHELIARSQGRCLGESYCRFSGARSIQYGFESTEDAQNAHDQMSQADLSIMGNHYDLHISKITNQGWIYPQPVQPVFPPH